MIAILSQLATWAVKDIRNLIIAMLCYMCLWLWLFNPVDKNCPNEPIIASTITTTTTDTTITHIPIPAVEATLTPTSITILPQTKLTTLDTCSCDTIARLYEYSYSDTAFEFFSVSALVRGLMDSVKISYKLKPIKQIEIETKTFELKTILKPDNRLSLSGGLLYQKDNLIPSVLLNKAKWSVYFGYDIQQKNEVDKYSFGIYYKFRIFGKD